MADEIMVEEVEAYEDVPVGDEGEVTTPFEFSDEEENLVEVFLDHDDGVEYLRKLKARLLREFDDEWSAQEKNRRRQRDDYKLFLADLPPKSEPFVNCANVNVPIVTKNLMLITTRSYAELFGDWSSVFGVLPVGPDDQAKAEILTQHGNWQFREQIKDFSSQMFRAVFQFFFAGDVVATSYWDEERRQNRHEVLTADQFLCPYVYTSTMPDFSDCPWYAIIFRKYRNQLQALRGDWFGVEDLLDQPPPPWDQDPDAPIRQGVEKREGVEPPTEPDMCGPYKVIMRRGWLDLPNQSRDRWCEVIWDYHTGAILKLRVLEIPPWEERARFERQQKELSTYMALMAEYEALTGQAGMMLEAAEGNPYADYAAIENAKQQFEEVAGNRPPKPMWYDESMGDAPDPPRKQPVYLESHSTCMTPMAGNLGIGFGRMLADLNRAGNMTLDQVIDAASFGNAPPVFYSQSLSLPKNIPYAPGKFIPIPASATDLKQAFWSPPVSGGNPALFNITDRTYAMAETVAQAPAVLSGEPGKSGEAWRSYAARVEQATKQQAVLTRKFAWEFLRQIFINNAFLNSYFLDDEEIFGVNDHRGYTPMQVTRDMYRRSYDVTFRSDMQYTTVAEKMAKADDMMNLAQLVMQVQGPRGWPFMYASIRKVLESRHMEDMIPHLPSPEQPPIAPPPGPQGANGPTGPAPTGPPQRKDE